MNRPQIVRTVGPTQLALMNVMPLAFIPADNDLTAEYASDHVPEKQALEFRAH